MTKYLLNLILITYSACISAQSEVYVCYDSSGNKEYKNSGAVGGCERIDLAKVSNLAEKRKAKSATPLMTKNVSLGMTKNAVEKILGRPNMKRRLQSRKGITEEWTYRPNGKLSFQDGVLEVIED